MCCCLASRSGRTPSASASRCEWDRWHMLDGSLMLCTRQRDATRLLSAATHLSAAALRLHAPRDRRAVGVRGRSSRYEPRAHSEGDLRDIPSGKGRRLQGCGAHDAESAERAFLRLMLPRCCAAQSYSYRCRPSATWLSSSSTSRIPRTAQTASSSIRRSSSAARDCTSCGGLDDISPIRQAT